MENLSTESKARKEIRKSVFEARRNYAHHMRMYTRDTKLLKQLSGNIVVRGGLGSMIQRMSAEHSLKEERKVSVELAKQFLEKWTTASNKDIETAINDKQRKKAQKFAPDASLSVQLQQIEAQMNDPGPKMRDPFVEAEPHLYPDQA